MCVYSSLSCGKVEYTCTLHHSARSIFEIDFQTGHTFFRFKLNFKILKLYLRFQINSNGFSRYRSFGHYCSCLSCQTAVHWPFAMYDIFIYFRLMFQTFLKLSLTVQPTVVKKRQKFGDVVKDIFPSQWFFHALYKKTGRRDMRPPRSDFL